MKLTSKQLVHIAVFTAITSILAQISINIPPVPLTMTIFAVFLSGAVLGGKCGFLSQVVYILLGMFGAPVFQGFQGGLDIIMSPRGGYIISFPIMALVVGLLIERKKQASRMEMAGAMLIGLIICYVIGGTWLAAFLRLDFAKAVTVGVAPFLPLDIIKVMLASVLAWQVRLSLYKAGLLT